MFSFGLYSTLKLYSAPYGGPTLYLRYDGIRAEDTERYGRMLWCKQPMAEMTCKNQSPVVCDAAAYVTLYPEIRGQRVKFQVGGAFSEGSAFYLQETRVLLLLGF